MISVETYRTVVEASGAMGQSTSFFGGGTLLMRGLNYGQQNFTKIVRSTDPSLKQISVTGDRIVIGAGVTMSQIIASSDVAFLAPVAKSIGGPAIRNMATVGGNLFAGHPYGDLTAALLALDGKVQTSNGQEQTLEQFLATRDQFSGIVTSVSIARAMPSDFKYLKVSRVKPKGTSVLSIAAWLPKQSGQIQNPQIAFGAMGVVPARAKGAEQALQGNSLDQASVENACRALAIDFSPPDDPLASGWYRNQVAPIHLKRLLLGEGQR